MGSNFFSKLVREARADAEINRAVTAPGGKRVLIKVHVFPSIVKWLELFGIILNKRSGKKVEFQSYQPFFDGKVNRYKNLTLAPDSPVANWTTAQKFDAVVKRAILRLPGNVGAELLALIDPLAIGIAVAVVVVWAASHFVGVGEIADVVLLIVGIISIGPIAWTAGNHLIDFAMGTVNAKSEEDLDKAADNLSKAVSLLGVQVILALLLKKAPKVLNEPQVIVGKRVTPLSLKTVGEPPTSPGWFYKPKITEYPSGIPNKIVGGGTNKWGDVTLSVGGKASLSEIELVKFHEQFHSLLKPKLQVFPWLRQTQTVLKTNSYLRSYILRYIEEALAQTFARIKTRNWRNVFEGIKFPIGEEGYVTVAKMGVEATGVLLGPINVSGMLLNVYFTYSEAW